MKRYIAVVLMALAVVCPGEGQAEIGAQISAKADVTVTNAATLVLAANAFRSALNCTNTSATVHVRWGDSAVTASTGQRLPAATAIEIANIGAVYMISEGANVTVSCTEETRCSGTYYLPG